MDRCNSISYSSSGTTLNMVFGLSTTMTQLVNTLNSAARLDRPVVDQTGLTGEYDFALTPGVVKYDGAGNRTPRSQFAMFEALEDELGLKLEATRANVDVLQIQRIQQPAAN